MTKIRDNFWLWGQNVGSHHRGSPEKGYKLPGTNRMDAAEGCKFFGIPNCCRVVMSAGPEPPFDNESEKIKDCKEVVWSAVGAGGVERNSDNKSDIEEVLRQAEKFPNVTGAVLDDFFRSVEGFKNSGTRARHTVDSIREIRDRLHGFPGRKLDLWVVWYNYQLDFQVSDYLEFCDVITFWTWKGSDLAQLDENIQKCVEKTPGKRHLAGCYMWNYGERCPLTRDQMQHQLDCYEKWIKKGVLEGIVLCSNCIADIGLETVDQMRAWINRVGEERIVKT